MEKVTIRAPQGDKIGEMPIEYQSLFAPLVIHQTYEGRGWTLTHTKSGGALRVGIRRKNDAIKLMEKIQSSVDWNFRNINSPKWKKQRSTIRDIVFAVKTYGGNTYTGKYAR